MAGRLTDVEIAIAKEIIMQENFDLMFADATKGLTGFV